SGSERETGAPSHANSICAFSGQNDFRPENGQIVFHVQSPGQEHRLGNTPPGVPGEACKGFSNPENPRAKKGWGMFPPALASDVGAGTPLKAVRLVAARPPTSTSCARSSRPGLNRPRSRSPDPLSPL